MKKFFIFLLLIIHLNTFAVTGGVKGGMNYTIPQAKNGYEEHFSNDYGYTWGGFLNFNLIDKLFLDTELMINSWQFKYKENDEFNTIGFNDFTALELNLILNYNFFNNIFVNLGIFWGFPISHKFNVESEHATYNYNGSSRFDILVPTGGLSFGLMYKYEHFIVNIRYLHNISELISKTAIYEEEDANCESDNYEGQYCKQNKFHQFQLLIGYEF